MKKIRFTLLLGLAILSHGIATAQTADHRAFTAFKNLRRATSALVPSKEEASDSVVLNEPEGTKKTYARNASVFEPAFNGYEIVPDKELGRASDIIDGNDGNVYISNAFILKYITNSYYTARDKTTHMNLSDSKGYFKGRRDADGNIVLPMPQKMSLTEYGDTYIFKVCIFNKEKVDTSYIYVPSTETEDKQIVLHYDAASDSYSMLTSTADIPDKILGIDNGGGEWLGYGEYNMNWQAVKDTLVIPPAGSTIQKWEYTNTKYYIEPESYVVDVAWNGNDVYVKGMNHNMPDAWVKGELDSKAHNSIVFDENQYMGVDTVTSYHIYFKPAYKRDNRGPVWDDYYESFTFLPQLSLNYDGQNKTITSPTDTLCAVFNSDKNEIYNMNEARNISLRIVPDNLDPTPADPTDVDIYMSSDYGWIEFKYDGRNKDGYLIDQKNVYYNIIGDDGQPMTFTPADYAGLTESVTNIPINFTDANGDFLTGEGLTMVTLYDTSITRAGVQICNVEDGKTYKSNIVWYIVPSDGINNVTNHGKIVSTVYYDMSGRRVSSPNGHMTIRVDKYADGTSSVSKTIR